MSRRRIPHMRSLTPAARSSLPPPHGVPASSRPHTVAGMAPMPPPPRHKLKSITDGRESSLSVIQKVSDANTNYQLPRMDSQLCVCEYAPEEVNPNYDQWSSSRLASRSRSKSSSQMQDSMLDSKHSSDLHLQLSARRSSFGTQSSCPGDDLGDGRDMSKPVLHSSSAWSAFADAIKNIDDNTMYFASHFPRNFKYSETFKDVCTNIDYSLPSQKAKNKKETVEQAEQESIQEEEPAPMNVFITNTIESESEDEEDHQSGTDEEKRSSTDTQDVYEINASPQRRSNVVHFLDTRSESVSYFKLVPASTMSRTLEEVRQELYRRYIFQPETWADGHNKHLPRPVELRPRSRTPGGATNLLPQNLLGTAARWGGPRRLNGASVFNSRERFSILGR